MCFSEIVLIKVGYENVEENSYDEKVTCVPWWKFQKFVEPSENNFVQIWKMRIFLKCQYGCLMCLIFDPFDSHVLKQLVNFMSRSFPTLTQ